MTTEPRYIGEDAKFRYFEAMFQGSPLRIQMSKQTGEILFHGDDCIKLLGLGDSVGEFLSSDKGLDLINDFKRDNPGTEVFGNNGLFRKPTL